MENLIIQFPVPMVLKIIMKSKISGELHVKGKNFEKTLIFKNGRLVQAKSNLLHERLGEILFMKGKVNHRQLIEINSLLVEKKRPERMGRLLVRNKMISQQDLFQALLYQIKAISISLFSLDSGTWHFIEQSPKHTNLVIELPEILVEGARQIKNFNYFKNKFSSLLPEAQKIADHLVDLLTDNEIKFNKILHKLNGKSNQEIEEKLKVKEDFYWRKIILLYLIDAVDFKKSEKAMPPQKTREDPGSKNIDDIMSMYEKITVNNLDYYELLGVQSSAPPEEIQRIYTRTIQKYHPDQIPASSHPELKKKALVIFGELNKAFKTLSNIYKRREYDSQHNIPQTVDDLTLEDSKQRAEAIFENARALYSQEQFSEASTLLDEAIKLDGSQASYYYYQGICQMMIPDFKKKAEVNLKKAAAMEPQNADMLYALGVFYESLGQQEMSERFIQKAMALKKNIST